MTSLPRKHITEYRTADGERLRDTQVGVFVKAPAVTVFGRSSREGSSQTD